MAVYMSDFIESTFIIIKVCIYIVYNSKNGTYMPTFCQLNFVYDKNNYRASVITYFNHKNSYDKTDESIEC